MLSPLLISTKLISFIILTDKNTKQIFSLPMAVFVLFVTFVKDSAIRIKFVALFSVK